MAFKCNFCGKGPMAGKTVSHSKRATVRSFYPNLFRKRVVIQGNAKRMLVCSTCLKSNKTVSA